MKLKVFCLACLALCLATLGPGSAQELETPANLHVTIMKNSAQGSWDAVKGAS